MKKGVLKIAVAILVFSLAFATIGCSQISDLTQVSSPNSPNIVRGTTLGEEWRMDQLIVNVGADMNR